jgi:hypothetical protein
MRVKEESKENLDFSQFLMLSCTTWTLNSIDVPLYLLDFPLVPPVILSNKQDTFLNGASSIVLPQFYCLSVTCKERYHLA